MKFQLTARVRAMLRTSALQIGPVQICTPFLLCAGWFWVLLWDSSGFFLLGLMASFWHELGHIFCYELLFRRLPGIRITLLGICMETKDLLSSKQALILATSGPAMNLAGSGLCLLLMQRQVTVRLAALFSANILVGGFNLLPVPPLDGFQIIAALLCLVQEKLHFGSE